MLYMEFWNEKKMDIKFETVCVFQCPFPFFISLIHIWHHFISWLLFFQNQIAAYRKIVAAFLLLSPMNEISAEAFIKDNCC
jgi:hypothetical protein